MKKRVILSTFILSLFLLLSSCGIPNLFYLSDSSIYFKNSQSEKTKTTTVRIDSDKYDLKIEFFLLYTINDASSSSEPLLSTVSSSLRSDFKTRHDSIYATRINSNINASYTSNQLTFNMYPFRVIGADSNMNSGDAPLFSYERNRGDGSEINFQVSYSLVEVDGNRYLEATMSDNNGYTESHFLGRYNGGQIPTDELLTTDSLNDHTHIESNAYNLYVYPVIYISSDTLSDAGYPYNNLMLVTTSDFITIEI